MTLRFNDDVAIDNLGHYPPATVRKLRALLAAGAQARPDPRRQNFYDVEDGSRVYYVHLSRSGKVWLLATWLKPIVKTPCPGTARLAEPCAC